MGRTGRADDRTGKVAERGGGGRLPDGVGNGRILAGGDIGGASSEGEVDTSTDGGGSLGTTVHEDP
jgi:hypothetical protein